MDKRVDKRLCSALAGVHFIRWIEFFIQPHALAVSYAVVSIVGRHATLRDDLASHSAGCVGDGFDLLPLVGKFRLV